jgi:hypothetical protein
LNERKLFLREFNLDSIFFAHADLKSNIHERLYTRSTMALLNRSEKLVPSGDSVLHSNSAEIAYSPADLSHVTRSTLGLQHTWQSST